MAKFHKRVSVFPTLPTTFTAPTSSMWCNVPMAKKELNIVIETKDIPNDEAKRTVEDAKINNAERFFQQLKIDGYEVKFCRQLQNKKMANIISELLEEDASNPV